MAKAVLFDFDGVLTTGANGSGTLCGSIARKTGLDANTVLTAYRKYNQDLSNGVTTHKEIWPAFCRDLGQELDFSLLQEAFLETPIDGEMVSLVRELKAAGNKTGMVTDNKEDRLEAVIKHHNWEGLFDAVALSARVGSGKDKEGIFLEALRLLDLPAEECIFIDNSRDNLTVPAGMGMHTIYFDHDLRDMEALKNRLKKLGAAL